VANDSHRPDFDVKGVAPHLLACHHCDLLHLKVEVADHEIARCQRCRGYLYTRKPYTADAALAYSVAALVTFLLAHSFPFLTISLTGNSQSMSVISAVYALAADGMLVLALFCLAFILLFPLCRICALIYILLSLRIGRRWPGTERIFRLLVSLSPWSMMEIYLLGAVVSLVKLATMVSIELGVSFWAFAALNVLALLASQQIDSQSLWQMILNNRERQL